MQGNGTELTSCAILRSSTGRLDWHYIEPGNVSEPISGSDGESNAFENKIRSPEIRSPWLECSRTRLATGVSGPAIRTNSNGGDAIGTFAERRFGLYQIP